MTVMRQRSRGLGIVQGEPLLYGLCPWHGTCRRLSGLIPGDLKLFKSVVRKSQSPKSSPLPLCSSDFRKLHSRGIDLLYVPNGSSAGIPGDLRQALYI